MAQAGEKYNPSGKFDIARTAIGLVAGILGAMVIGYVYGIITDVDPLIYLNLLVLVGTVIVLVAFTGFIRHFGSSRNRIVNIIVAAVLCYAAWYAQWVYFIVGFNLDAGAIANIFIGLVNPVNVINIPLRYSEIRTISIGHFGSGGAPITGTGLLVIYFIEFIAFMSPVYFASVAKEYYCESCNNFYAKAELWSAEVSRFNDEFSRSPAGSYGFLSGFAMSPAYSQLGLDPSQSPELLKAEYHYCEACNQNDIIDLSTTVLKYNNKKKEELSGEKTLIQSMYVDQRTSKAMMDKIKGRVAGTVPVEPTE